MRTDRRASDLGCLMLLVIQPGLCAQQQKGDSDQDKNIIKQHTSLVTVDVTVTDKQYRQIGGLSKEHFEVYEDKVRQQIDFFSDEDRPASIRSRMSDVTRDSARSLRTATERRFGSG